MQDEHSKVKAAEKPSLQLARAEEQDEEDEAARQEDLANRARRARMMRSLKRFMSQ